MGREVWAEIDARHATGELSPLEVVAGLPILIRILKQTVQLGWRGARVVVTTGQLAEIRQAIERARLPAAFVIEYDVGDGTGPLGPAGDAISGGRRASVALDGRALYDRDLLAEAAETGQRAAPEMLIRDDSQARLAERRLLDKTKKNLILDGLVAYFVMRPLSRLMTRALVNTRVSQHIVTMLALATGLVGALLASRGTRQGVMAAGFLYFGTGILDCVDGDLARLRLAQSRLGAWLDSLTDEAVTFSLVLGLGHGMARHAGPEWAWASYGIFGLAVVTLGKMYSDLSRRGLPIDTALYPWFFMGDAKPDTTYPPRGFFGRLLFGLSFLIRRDANVTIIAGLLVFGWPHIAMLGIGIVIGAVSLLLLTHVLVQAGRDVADA